MYTPLHTHSLHEKITFDLCFTTDRNLGVVCALMLVMA